MIPVSGDPNRFVRLQIFNASAVVVVRNAQGGFFEMTVPVEDLRNVFIQLPEPAGAVVPAPGERPAGPSSRACPRVDKRSAPRRQLPFMSEVKVGLIGGTGLGQALLPQQTTGTRHEIDTPFGRPSDAIVETEWAGVPVLFLSRHGPGHLLNPSQVPYRANIFALKHSAARTSSPPAPSAACARNSSRADLVIPDQVIDKTFRRAGTFFENAAVHVEFAEPSARCCVRFLLEAGKAMTNPSVDRCRPRPRLLRRAWKARRSRPRREPDAPPLGRRPDRHDGDARGEAGPGGGDGLRAGVPGDGL